MSDGAQNGWNEWSKHVLKELQRLNDGQDSLKQNLHDIRNGMVKVSVIENSLKEVKAWKDSVTEVASPTQLQELVKKVEGLESFKVKAMAIIGFSYVVLTIAVAIVAAL